jgi:hypothetical protein
MQPYAARFGECDADGNCGLSTLAQSSITGLLCLGAMFGAVFSGNIANRVSPAALMAAGATKKIEVCRATC